jgi:hypothetical protein
MNAKCLQLGAPRSNWSKSLVPLCQVCGCALAVLIGFFMSATIGAVAMMPVALWPEAMWASISALCLFACIQGGWMATFAAFAVRAHRRRRRYSVYVYTALACGATPYAILAAVMLITSIYGGAVSLVYG